MSAVDETQTANARQWRRLQFVFTLGAATVVFLLLSRTVLNNFDVLLARPLSVNWLALLGSFIVYVIDLILAVIAWHLIVRRLLGIDDWRKNTRIYLGTLLARRLPGSIWHIVGRVQLYAQSGIPKAATSVSGAVDFVVFFVAGGTLYLALWPWLRGQEFSGWVLLSLVPLGSLLLFPNIVVWITRRVSRQDVARPVRRRDMIGWLLSQITVWLFGGVVLYLLILSIYPLPIDYIVATLGAGILATMVGMIAAFTPVGLGLRELTLSALLLPFVPAPYNVIAAVGTRVILTLYDLVVAGIVLWYERRYSS